MQLQSRPRLTFLPEAHGIFSYDFFFEAWDLKTILEYFSCNVRVWAAKWFLIGPSQACMASIWQLTCSKKRLSDTFTALSVCWTALLESIASGWKKKNGGEKTQRGRIENERSGVLVSNFFSPSLVFVPDPVLDLGTLHVLFTWCYV